MFWIMRTLVSEITVHCGEKRPWPRSPVWCGNGVMPIGVISSMRNISEWMGNEKCHSAQESPFNTESTRSCFKDELVQPCNEVIIQSYLPWVNFAIIWNSFSMSQPFSPTFQIALEPSSCWIWRATRGRGDDCAHVRCWFVTVHQPITCSSQDALKGMKQSFSTGSKMLHDLSSSSERKENNQWRQADITLTFKIWGGRWRVGPGPGRPSFKCPLKHEAHCLIIVIRFVLLWN